MQSDAATASRSEFASIYATYAVRVQRFVRARVSDPDLADDITSETFVRAWKSIDRYRDTGSDIGTWLCAIALNLLADHWKSARVRREVVWAEPGHDLAVYETPEHAAIASEDARHAAQTVTSLLRLLSADQLGCITLRYWRELSINEVAIELGRSPDAVKQLHCRAIRKLRVAVG